MALESASIPTRDPYQDGLAFLASQIEAELYRSKIYRTALTRLRQEMGDAAESAQVLIKAVGKKAIRLALEKLAKNYPAFIPHTPEEGQNYDGYVSNNPDDMHQYSVEETVKYNGFGIGGSSVQEVSEQSNTSAPSMVNSSNTRNVKNNLRTAPCTQSYDPKPPARKKKLSKAEREAQAALQSWKECLGQIGQEIRQARINHGLSLYQLHQQTLIPCHHLDALEKGSVEDLPEDVYIRGFIRRVGDSLGLDGTRMAASLPVLERFRSVVPSWHQQTSSSGLYLSPVHLYVGYAALMAGAVGTLTWLSQESPPGAVAEPDPAFSAPTSQSEQSTVPTHTPGLKSHEKGISAGTDIAPPEALPNPGKISSN